MLYNNYGFIWSRRVLMYSIFAIMFATVAALVATMVTVSPAPGSETVSMSNIPPMYEIEWGSDEPISPEADFALRTFFVCEYTDRGHAAMTELRDTLGSMTLTDNDSERQERAEIMYGLTRLFQKEGSCWWSDYEQDYFLSGSLLSTEEYDLKKVSCTALENGMCVSIQPMANYRGDEIVEVVYSLFSDAVMDEIFSGEQWAIIN